MTSRWQEAIESPGLTGMGTWICVGRSGVFVSGQMFAPSPAAEWSDPDQCKTCHPF
jgi:hypothetical protein